MKTIAYWSRDHKFAARIMIGFCHLAILLLGCYIGIGLSENHIFISPKIIWISLSLLLLVNILFSKSYKSFTFNKRKILDGLVLASSFLLIISFSNQKNISQFTFYNSTQSSFDQKTIASSVPTTNDADKGFKAQWKEFKKMMRQDKASAAGIVLAIIVGAFLAILLASASCSLSCNNQDTLAILVLIAGIPAIFFICKWIIKGTRKKTGQETDKKTSPAMKE